MSVMYASLAGNGHKPPVESYRNQGVDLRTRPYGWPLVSQRRAQIERSRSLDAKYAGQVSPVSGRSVAELVRTGGEMAVSPCGNCGIAIAHCRCDFR